MSKTVPPIGTLTDRVVLRAREGDEWLTLSTVWARVRSLASNSPDDDTHSVVIRFRSDISAGDRIISRGRTLDVTSAGDLNGRRAYLAIRAKEVQP